MFVNISEAAKLAGVSRSTLYRAIESGRLSKADKGLDVAELERVYGRLRTPGEVVRGASTDRPKNALVEHLPGQLDVLRQQLDFLQRQLDAEREEKRRLLDLLESAQLALTHQPAPQPQAEPQHQQSGGLFGWIRR